VTHSPSARVAASTNVLFLFFILGYSHCIASGIQCVCGPATLSDVRKLPPSAKRNGGYNRVQTNAGVAMETWQKLRQGDDGGQSGGCGNGGVNGMWDCSVVGRVRDWLAAPAPLCQRRRVLSVGGGQGEVIAA